ncbi:hypothetical protein JYU34_018912, partial [Plutella xylostella]
NTFGVTYARFYGAYGIDEYLAELQNWQAILDVDVSAKATGIKKPPRGEEGSRGGEAGARGGGGG